MNGNVVAWFIKGAADEGLDGLRERRRADAEIKKAKLLEQLRVETAKDLENFKLEIERKKVDKSQTQYDLGQGKKKLYNDEGTLIGTADMTDTEKSEFSNKAEKDKLDAENIRSQIESRNQQLGLERERLNLTRQQLSRSGSGGGRGRGLDSAGELGALKTIGDRIRLANTITDRLGKSGLASDEVMAARAELLEGAQRGWDLNQFLEFEKVFTGDPRLRGMIRARGDQNIKDAILKNKNR